MLKYIYLVGSMLATMVIFILAFENIQAICVDLNVFFTTLDVNTPPTILVFWVAGLGVVTGFFYHGLIYELFKKKDDEDEDDF